MQGDFTNLLIQEKENVTWQAVIKNVPKGIMSFALNSVTNTLQSPDNLKRWGNGWSLYAPFVETQARWNIF